MPALWSGLLLAVPAQNSCYPEWRGVGSSCRRDSRFLFQRWGRVPAIGEGPGGAEEPYRGCEDSRGDSREIQAGGEDCPWAPSDASRVWPFVVSPFLLGSPWEVINFGKDWPRHLLEGCPTVREYSPQHRALPPVRWCSRAALKNGSWVLDGSFGQRPQKIFRACGEVRGGQETVSGGPHIWSACG